MEKKRFVPGLTYIPSSGKVFGKEEIDNAIRAAKDGWWTEGNFARLFERNFSKFMGVKCVTLVNSGSSANLLALASLTTNHFGTRRLRPGDEFITTPVAFPTTVNPGILYQLKPVFLDIDLETLSIDCKRLEKAISPKTKLIMVAHTLGKPFNLDAILRIAKKHNLWVIEDCCDALGSRFRNQLVGTFGDIATYSFYPAHQITMGEGGAIITNNPFIHRTIRQLRDWGRDCWCEPGKDNTCGRRFSFQLGNLPFGYDHKYSYSQIGYNLKLTDFQAAIGVAQLKRLPGFIVKRKKNYEFLLSFFRKYKKYFILPKTSIHEDPCWFGFPVIVKTNSAFTRNQFTQYLELHKIGTRNIFSGNLLKHPAYRKIRYKTIGKMINSDIIMNDAFWIGVYPGIGKKQLMYMKKIITSFMDSLTSSRSVSL